MVIWLYCKHEKIGLLIEVPVLIILVNVALKFRKIFF